MTDKSRESTCFQLKGSIFTLHVLHLLRPEVATVLTQLQELISRSPNYFNYAPLVIDIAHLEQTSLNYAELTQGLRELNLIPIGVRGIDKAQAQPIYDAGLALFPSSRKEEDNTFVQNIPESTAAVVTSEPAITEEVEPVTMPVTVMAQTLLITQPIRSGQQVYAQGADLIVHAQVSQGAELIADGNIHVYGPLRGRALAGVSGNKNARIYCQKLEAELVSVAGHYSVSEDIKFTSTQPMCIYLENDSLQLKPF